MTDCGDCLAYIFKDGTQGYILLWEACASVGIERGKSTDQTFAEYVQAYHERGHRD